MTTLFRLHRRIPRPSPKIFCRHKSSKGKVFGKLSAGLRDAILNRPQKTVKNTKLTNAVASPTPTTTVAKSNNVQKQKPLPISKDYQYPYSQLRAYLFDRTLLDAKRQLGIAKAIMYDRSPLLTSLRIALGNNFPRLLKLGIGLRPPEPESLKLVYFPVWMVDGEIQAKVVNMKGGEQKEEKEEGKREEEVTQSHKLRTTGGENPIMLGLTDIYLPGSDQEPFYRTRLLPYDVPTTTATTMPRFTYGTHRRQHGEEVKFVPFNISPSSLFEAVKDWDPGQTKIADIRLVPHSMQLSLFAYPVLIPMYVAEYKAVSPTGEEAIVKLYMEGYLGKAVIFAENPFHEGKSKPYHFLQKRPHMLKVKAVMVGGYSDNRFPRLLQERLGEALSTPGVIQKLAAISKKIPLGQARNMEGPVRLRDYSVAGRELYMKWLASGFDIYKLKLDIKENPENSARNTKRIGMVNTIRRLYLTRTY